MKKVFSSIPDCIHTYAQRTQSEGRSSNVFFYGDKIYSYGYHYLLGEFLDDKTIMINDKGYSSFTGNHIRILRSATRQYKQFYTTETSIDLVYSEIKRQEQMLARAKKPENYINIIFRLWGTINKFIEYRKDKNIVKDVRYKEIKTIVKALQDDSVGFKEKLAEARRKELESKARKERKQIKELLPKFLSYEINSFRVGEKDYLRLSLDKESIETSQNVSVPVNEAKELYKAIVNKVDIAGRRIGNYTVTSINGTLKIGCHSIDMDSVHNVGKQLIK